MIIDRSGKINYMHLLPVYKLMTNDYEDNRRFLLTKSFFIYRLILNLRKDLVIPDDGHKTMQDIIVWENERVLKFNADQIFKPINKRKISVQKTFRKFFTDINQFNDVVYLPIIYSVEKFADLNLNFEFLKSLTLGGPHFSISGTTRVYTITSTDDPIKEPGVYIRYTPELSNQDLAKIKSEAFHAYQILFNISNPQKAQKILDKQAITRTKTSPSDKAKKAYIAVENKFIELSGKKGNLASFKVVFPEIVKDLSIPESNLKRLYYQAQNNFHLPPVTLATKI